MYQSHYKIAGISITVTAQNSLQDDDTFAEYRICQEGLVEVDSHYDIYVEIGGELVKPTGACLFQNEMNMVFKAKPPLHYFQIPGTRHVCEWDLLEDSSQKTLHCHPDSASYFSHSTGIFNAVGMERILYQFQKYLYHCSYVDIGGRAILFSAPSGGGKTTQGKFWEKYRGATMVNGDRAVLEDCGDGILCYGLPIAGSSNVFLNRTLPLTAIFTLEKAKENKLQRLKGKEAVYAVYSQLTVNMWNSQFVKDAFDFSMAVAAKVPVYKLSCNISKEAVDIVFDEICGTGDRFVSHFPQ